MRFFSLVALLSMAGLAAPGQSPETDSLKQAVADSPNDSARVDRMLELSKSYFSSSPEKAVQIAEEAKVIALRIGYIKGVGYALKNLGLVNYIQSNNLKALEYWQESLAEFEKIRFKPGEANILQNLGAVYFNEATDDKALEYYLRALKLADELADSNRIAEIMANIAAIYGKKKESWDKSIDFASRALPIAEKLGNMDAVGTLASNIGEIYLMMKDDTTALSYFKKSVRAYEGSEYLPYALNNMGRVYRKRKDFDQSVEYHQQALDFARNLDLKYDITQSLRFLALAYDEKGDNKQATERYLEAMALGLEINAYEELKEIYDGLAKAYAKSKDFGNAYKYQQKLQGVRDSIYSQETNRKLGSLYFTYEIDKKENEIKLQDKEISRQKVVRNSFIGGFGIVLLFAGIFLSQRNRISKEKKRSDELLLNILPEETAEELKATGTAKAKSFDSVTVLFTDFKNFTQASERLSPEELVEEINHCYSEFDKIITRHGIEKIKTIGDAYMCAGGLPAPNATHPGDVVAAGLEMQDFIRANKEERMKKGQPFFELRLGIHTGPVVAGIVGIKKFAYDIWGDTVNTASRMESSGEVGKVNISGTTYDLVKDAFRCTYRGKVKAKNKGEIDMYFVEGPANGTPA